MSQLPKVSPEKEAQRDAIVASYSKPAPATDIQLPSAPISASYTDTAPAPVAGTSGGEQETADGKAQVTPLPSDARSKLTKSFEGFDFSGVTIRRGTAADAECTRRGALAYTIGNTITMSSAAKEDTLMHEAAHVVQQTSAGPDPAGDRAAPQAKGNHEEQADTAASAVAAGAPAAVTSAPAGVAQNKDSDGGHANALTVSIPMPGGRSIKVSPPNKSGDWSAGVGDVVKWKPGIKEDLHKWWRKSIPTPFFGLSADIGAGFFFKFSMGEVKLSSILVKYKAATDTYSLEAKAGTAMSTELGGFLSAGVSADIWIASAGIGLKAKLSVQKNQPLSVAMAIGYSPTTGETTLKGTLSLTAIELLAKAGVSLYVYYDAIGVSTYTKDWTLAEKTLGKLSVGGLDGWIGWSSRKGFDGGLKAKPASVQDMAGKIKNLYPSKS